jgi:hypothetical protein
MLWERLKPFYGSDRVEDEDGQFWKAKGLNSWLRLCRYEKGGRFTHHIDGRRLASVEEQSFMTVNVYLNTVEVDDGGATRALSGPGMNGLGEGEVLGRVQPVMGRAAVFRDSLWHDGEELLRGVKVGV